MFLLVFFLDGFGVLIGVDFLGVMEFFIFVFSFVIWGVR